MVRLFMDKWMALSQNHRWLSPLVAGVLIGSASLVNAEVAWPVGELDVQGTAIITKASGGSVTITNGTYTWFSGDQVENRSGQSLLILDNGASFGFGESTTATVVVAEDSTSVDLTQGSVLYTTTADNIIDITSGETSLSTQLTNPPVCTLGPVASVGLVQLDEGGVTEVQILEGAIFYPITSASGEEEWFALTAEASYLVSESGVVEITESGSRSSDGQTILPLTICALADGTRGTGTAAVGSVTQSTSTTTEALATTTTSTTATTAGTTSAKWVVGGFALAVTAASTYVVAFDDDEEPVTEPPVSP